MMPRWILKKRKPILLQNQVVKSLLSEEIREITTSDKGQEFNEERAVEATAIIAPKAKTNSRSSNTNREDC